jgi:hypothetical protein
MINEWPVYKNRNFNGIVAMPNRVINILMVCLPGLRNDTPGGAAQYGEWFFVSVNQVTAIVACL